ncbi:HepT-like ribonuclease domain-containing protein [Rubrobacter aplysinae]|uniref:HepT-like ribonuclease domain-containing protein n=1 Tax=Rubrobacter aplysinae TaxID=909625 RepID=UPI000A05AB25|nr:HepT-like ribonuclease domain-containing protein [Rubrobacter aplysinae]
MGHHGRCRAILEYVQGKEFSDYEHDRMLRRAVERELSVVGEAMSQATRRFPDLEESIGPARQIVGFRNRIIHEYAEVDTEIVWAIVQNEVPSLLENSESLLKESEYGR